MTYQRLTFVLFLLLVFHTVTTMGGRGQRKQRQAEERLRPYISRVDPEILCELLKCHSPVGSWCQAVQENGVLVPKCVCPRSCPQKNDTSGIDTEPTTGLVPDCIALVACPAHSHKNRPVQQRAPVCSVQGRTYGNKCLLHKDACRKKRRTGLAHTGACLVPRGKCTEEELGQFPYRLLDWFLLMSRMGESYTPGALPQSCLSHALRTQLAQNWFSMLDRNKDGKLSHRDLRKLRYKRMPLEHCATKFFRSCDQNRNRKVTLREWTTCVVDRTEAWFYKFMSMRMGSRKLCPAVKET